MVFGLLAMAASPVQAGRSATTVDWPEYGFDAANSNFNLFETVLDPSNVGGIDRIWTAFLGETTASSPALANGLVYVCAETHLFALDSGTGAEQWRAEFATWPDCGPPAVHDGRVFVNDGSQRLHALDASTGTKLWTVNLHGSATPAPPAVSDGVVYVGSSGARLFAVDEVTGGVLWRARTIGIIFSSPAIGGGRVFIESDNRMLYAFDAATGALDWSARVGGGSSSSPVYADGVVYAPGWHGERITALDAVTGAVLWTVRLSCNTGTPALASGVLIVPVGCEERMGFVTMDPATGARLWHAALPDSGGTPSPPAVANGVVYITSNGHLGIFDASNGDRLKVVRLGQPQIPPPAPIIANGTVFVGSTYSRVEFYAYGL